MGGRGIYFRDLACRQVATGVSVAVDRKGVKQTISRPWEGLRGLAWTPDGNEVWYTAASAASDYAIWAGEENRILYYNCNGERIAETKLSEAPDPHALQPA